MASPSRMTKCPRCGLMNPSGVTSCGACGLVRSSGGAGGALTTSTPPTTAGGGAVFPKPHARGARAVSGIVIHVDSVYMTKPESSLGKFLLKVCVALMLLPLVLILGVPLLMLSWLFGRSSRSPGLPSGLANQFLSFWLTSKLFKKDDVPVRDIRVRDLSGVEHLVRIRGHFITGNVNVADDVTMEGVDRGGTLMFRRGTNHRTHCEILVKLQ